MKKLEKEKKKMVVKYCKLKRVRNKIMKERSNIM